MALHLQFGQLDKLRADIEENFDDVYYTYTIIESTLGSLKDDLFFFVAFVVQMACYTVYTMQPTPTHVHEHV